ncbi:zinc finger protein, partial [Wuchereria bancrofti]
ITAPMEDEIQVVFEYLKREPDMYRVLQRFVSETVQFERSLITRLEEAERRLEEMEGPNAHEEMEEEPVPQEPAFNEEEAEWAPLPESESGDEADNWPSGAEWAPLPDTDEEDDEVEVPVAPMETNDVAEPVEAVRELV